MRVETELSRAAIAVASLLFLDAARSETINCTAITNALVPYTITAPGVYCVTEKISTNLASGAAITINANNVVLDLNDFAIGNLAAGVSTLAIGVLALDRQNIVLQNGILRGFWVGVGLFNGTTFGQATATSSGHLVQNVTSDHSYVVGIIAEGPDCTVSNSRILSTQGSAVVNPLAPTQVNKAFGIIVEQGGNAHVSNNAVFDTDCANGCTASTALAVAIYAGNAPDAVVESNAVMNTTPPTAATAAGIVVDRTSPNVLVDGNAISKWTNGVIYTGTGATGKYRNNVTQHTTTPYSGGTPVGMTNF